MTDTRGIGQPRKPDWRDQADCRRLDDPEYWFPNGTTGPFVLQAEEAKAICRECPVALDCARWSIQKRMSDGVWGGLDEVQRRRVLRNNTADELTSARITQIVQAMWKKDVAQPLIDAYLNRTEQDDDGHVRWTVAATSITVGPRVLTPAQLGFEVGYGRRPEGHVKATCGQPFCVAAEHLADSRARRARRRPVAA